MNPHHPVINLIKNWNPLTALMLVLLSDGKNIYSWNKGEKVLLFHLICSLHHTIHENISKHVYYNRLNCLFFRLLLKYSKIGAFWSLHCCIYKTFSAHCISEQRTRALTCNWKFHYLCRVEIARWKSMSAGHSSPRPLNNSKFQEVNWMYIELCAVASFLCPDLSRSRYLWAFAVAGQHPRTNVNFRCLNRGNCYVYFREKLLRTNKSSPHIVFVSVSAMWGSRTPRLKKII